jgi:serine/threonine-protein kinase
MQLQSPVPRPSALAPLTPDIDAVIMRALEKRAERRFPSVSELLTAFRRAVTQAADLPEDVPSQALGLYFDVQHGDQEIDDEMFEDISVVLEIVEQELYNAAFLLPLRSATSLLGIRLLADESAVGYEQEEAQALVSTIQALLAERPDPHPAIGIGISLSIGQVLCRAGEHEQEVVGGPLLKVRGWPKEARLTPLA